MAERSRLTEKICLKFKKLKKTHAFFEKYVEKSVSVWYNIKDNEIELVQTIQEKDKRIKELEEKVKELEYMYENTKRELISRTNKYIELLNNKED